MATYSDIKVHDENKNRTNHNHQSPSTKPKHISHSRSYSSHKKARKLKKSNPSKRNRADIIADYLSKVPILSRLSRSDRYNLGKSFKQKIYKKHEVVIKQNEPGSEFFIITKGEASVIIKSETPQNNSHYDIVATLHPGDYFGETSLLTAKPRNATIKSNDNTLHCLVLDKSTFHSVFGKERVRVNFGKRGVE